MQRELCRGKHFKSLSASDVGRGLAGQTTCVGGAQLAGSARSRLVGPLHAAGPAACTHASPRPPHHLDALLIPLATTTTVAAMADHAPLAPKPGAQAYGATATRRTRPRTRYEACASSITLRQGYAQAPGGQASMLSSVANLCNTIIGAGICAMPYAFAAAGIVPGVLLVLLCGLTSYFGLYLLTRCAARLGGTRTSFFAVASAAMPRGSWDVRRLIDGAIAVKCFGVSISYLIISGQLMPQVVLGLTRVWHADPEKLPSALYTREFWILVWVLLLAPLTLLRRLDSLRHTSYLRYVSRSSLLAALPPDTAQLPLSLLPCRNCRLLLFRATAV